jgi:U3 small nucleolar RNA-associated protein 18
MSFRYLTMVPYNPTTLHSWDVNSRRCVERFSNNDGTITGSLASSSKHVAVGAESGVVNLYSEHFNGREKTPLKSIMNLHTSAESLQFNHDGQILAMSTRQEQHGLKLLHVPSRTVFSNWPTSKTPLKYVWSMAFSPQSRFLAMGNEKGKCLLYRLDHYQ